MKTEMKIRIRLTDQAEQYIREATSDGTFVQLVYDAEGCGCAVSGVPQLWQIEQHQAEQLTSACEQAPIVIDPNHSVFFEPELSLDLDPLRGLFRLASNQQIYHPGMPLLRKQR